MNQILYDAEYACNISQTRVTNNIYYDRIYYHSNEPLAALFSNFSVQDKDVLTVLASSDQYFYSYLNGAKSVDTFDINKLTYYYYYLRKWSILYCDDYYPPLEDLAFSHKFFSNVLPKHYEFSEEDYDAYLFWREYSNQTLGFQNKELFYLGCNGHNNRVEDLSFLKEVLKKELSFHHMDISQPIEIDKKYDVIILSNILEYLSFMDTDFDQLKSNLNSLLRDDGLIVCSHYMHRFSYDKSRMKDIFEYQEFPFIKRKSIIKEMNCPVGYSYRKKNILSTKKC